MIEATGPLLVPRRCTLLFKSCHQLRRLLRSLIRSSEGGKVINIKNMRKRHSGNPLGLLIAIESILTLDSF